MGLSTSKSGFAELCQAHLKTLYDARTNKRSTRDILEQVGIPLSVGGIAALAGWDFSATDALIGGTSLFAAFLFGLTIQLLGNAENLAETGARPGLETSRRIRLLEELTANAAWASLVSLGAATLLTLHAVAVSGSSPRWLSGVIAGVLTHLVIVILMVLKRVFFRTRERLVHARTSGRTPDEERSDH